MKRFFAIALCLLMVAALFACKTQEQPKPEEPQGQTEPANEPANEPAAEGLDIKVGFICLHDENSTYDLNFINAAKAACATLGIPEGNYIIKTNIPEGKECYETAADMADNGCKIIFADSFGHEDFMIQAAKEFPDVQFCHSTGTKAHTENLPNYHNAFAAIYEGRYLAGIAAGMKLKEMLDEGKITADQLKIGYVGAFTYAEVVSGYTSFFLGVKSIVPEVTMDVIFTGSWYDEKAEKESAIKLMDGGCVLISQHADSMGAPSACESRGVPNVSYNGSTVSVGPNTYIVSSRINWEPYYEYAIKATAAGEAIPADWTGTIDTGSVELFPLNDAVAAKDTQAAIDAAKAALAAGTLHVFSTDAFTVGGAKLDSYMADVDTDPAYTPDTEVISDGYFHESEFRSAPYFDLRIDGITLLNESY
ncbi:MAG: BMP family ABC transporter substrate-binding protein [Clostridia bacterium]|nr:BMP family ABC transporter substrate-binding protein [Clostridia bacterium]